MHHELVQKALLMNKFAVDTAATAAICDHQQSRIRSGELLEHARREGGGRITNKT